MTWARLVKRITDDGNMEVQDDVALGTIYHIDLEGRVEREMFNSRTGQHHRKVMVWDLGRGGYLPLELLEVLDHDPRQLA